MDTKLLLGSSMSNISVGKKGEELAQEFLKKQGYKILETNKHFSKPSFNPCNDEVFSFFQ